MLVNEIHLRLGEFTLKVKTLTLVNFTIINMFEVFLVGKSDKT